MVVLANSLSSLSFLPKDPHGLWGNSVELGSFFTATAVVAVTLVACCCLRRLDKKELNRRGDKPSWLTEVILSLEQALNGAFEGVELAEWLIGRFL